MAISLLLTPTQRNAVSALIGTQMGPFRAVLFSEAERDSSPPALLESFQLYVTTLRELLRAHDFNRPLAGACRDSGAWYHQIAMGDSIGAFALTACRKSDTFEDRLLALMNGILCRQVAQAIQKVDLEFSDEYFVTLVHVFDVSLYFFLITKESEEQVVIVSSLYSPEALEPLTVLSTRYFAERLQTLPRLGGIHFQPR